MLEAIFFLLASISILGINFYIGKNLFYPPAIFSLIWTIVILSYVLFILGHTASAYFLETKTLFIFLFGQILFSLAGLLAFKPKIYVTAEVSFKYEIIYSLDKWLFVFLIIMLPIYIKAIINVVDNSKLANVNFYLALRHEYVNNGVNLGVLDYLNTISVFSFSFLQYKLNFISKSTNRNKRRVIYKLLFYTTVFTYAFLSTGRTYFVLLLSVYLSFKVISKSIKKYHIISASLIFLILFIANAFILGKGASVDDSASENVSSIFDNFTIYFLGGAYGFDSSIKSGFVYEYGENVFRFFITVAHSFGITDVKPKELVMPYITNPIISNVYTLYYNYFKDFGFLGLLFNLVWGFVHTVFYYKAKFKPTFFNVYCYALLMYPLLMSFFQDQYMSLLSTWIQLLFFGFIASFFIVKQSIDEQRN